MTSDRILMNPRPSGLTKIKGKKADNSIIDMLTFDPDAQTITPKVPMVYGTRNYIINGGFDFWQRGTTGATSGPQSGVYLSADRWSTAAPSFSGGNQILSQSTSTPNSSFQYSLNITASAALTVTGGLGVRYSFERAFAEKFVNKTVTVSFWANSTKTGNYGIRLQINPTGGTGSDTTLTTFNISVANTWVFYSFTFTPTVSNWNSIASNAYAGHFSVGPCINGQGQTSWSGSDSFLLTGVQLNEGPVAAPFERAGGSIGGELQLCQRYYEKSFDINTAPANGANTTSYSTRVGLEYIDLVYRNALEINSYDAMNVVKFKTSKRTTGIAVTLYGNSAGAFYVKNNSGVAGWNGATGMGAMASINGFMLTNEVSSWAPNAIQFHWTAEAEL